MGKHSLQYAPSNGVCDLLSMLTYALTNEQWARPACPLVSEPIGQFVRNYTSQFSYFQLRRSVCDISWTVADTSVAPWSGD